jgi:hypothetical protein
MGEKAVGYSNEGYQATSRRVSRLSRHAEKRAQQRCISQASLPLVLAYGQREFDGHGGISYLMTSDSIASLRQAVGQTPRVDALAGVYAVVSVEDSTVITVGHRFG